MLDTVKWIVVTAIVGHLSYSCCHDCAAGEVLGCTAPVVAQSADAIVFVADGRFHLEAIMIANPDILAFRYDHVPNPCSAPLPLSISSSGVDWTWPPGIHYIFRRCSVCVACDAGSCANSTTVQV